MKSSPRFGASVRLGVVVGLLSAWALACDRGPDPNDPSQRQPVGYDQYGNPIYAPPGQQPQPYGTQPQPYGTQPQPTAQPTAQPSPLALPCQSDITCGTHKCNLQVGKCAFPCANAQTDCAAGMGCVGGVCVPGAGR